jgi:LysR substrate binding domain
MATEPWRWMRAFACTRVRSGRAAGWWWRISVLPAALATQHGERADLAALAAQQFLAPAPGAWGGLQRHLVEACRQAGFEPNVRDVKLVPTVVALVGAGLGVSILPSSVRAVRGDKVAVLPLAQPVPVVETAIVRRRDEPPAPPATHLLRLALSTPEPDMLAPELAPARTGRDAVCGGASRRLATSGRQRRRCRWGRTARGSCTAAGVFRHPTRCTRAPRALR